MEPPVLLVIPGLTRRTRWPVAAGAVFGGVSGAQPGCRPSGSTTKTLPPPLVGVSGWIPGFRRPGLTSQTPPAPPLAGVSGRSPGFRQ